MLSRVELKNQAKEQLQGKIGSFFIVLLAYLGMTLLLTFVGGLVTAVMPIAGYVVIWVLTPPLVIGYTLVFLNVTYGEKPRVSTLVDGYRNYFGKSIVLYLLYTLFIILWMLLLVIPGIIKSYAYAMCFNILAENPNMTAREALKESELIMKGHKFEYFVLQLSFIPWILLTCITFGIAGIYVEPYMQLTMTNFYHNIKRQNAEPVAETVDEIAEEPVITE